MPDRAYVFDGLNEGDAAEGAGYVARAGTGWKVGRGDDRVDAALVHVDAPARVPEVQPCVRG